MDYHRPLSAAESRRMSLATGIMWLITFATSIPALWLYQPVLDDPRLRRRGRPRQPHLPRMLPGAAADHLQHRHGRDPLSAAEAPARGLRARLRRRADHGEHVHPGRASSASSTVVGLRTDPSGRVSQETSGRLAYTFAAMKDWTFLLGPGFVVGIGNGLLFGYLMYTSGLVPRRMSVAWTDRRAVLIASGVAVMFGVDQPGGTLQGLCTIPEALWELLVGLYFTFKGFRPEAPILRGELPADRVDPRPAAVPAR